MEFKFRDKRYPSGVQINFSIKTSETSGIKDLLVEHQKPRGKTSYQKASLIIPVCSQTMVLSSTTTHKHTPMGIHYTLSSISGYFQAMNIITWLDGGCVNLSVLVYLPFGSVTGSMAERA